MSNLVRFGVSIDETLIREFDELIERKGYKSRSEALRDMIRDLLVKTSWEEEDKEQVATLTLVYDHEVREVTEKLNDLQHEHHSQVISSIHVHLTRHHCLEVLVMKGSARDIREISDRLIATKGVRHGNLTMTTKGEEF